MDLNDIKAVYFIGIGGIGMSAIARYFLSKRNSRGRLRQNSLGAYRTLEGRGCKGAV